MAPVMWRETSSVLPLRMVTGGAGPRTPITLFIVSEAQYVPQNFPSSVIQKLET